MSNQKVTVWPRYEEQNGTTSNGQTEVNFTIGNEPLPESLTVSVGPLDGTDVAATDLIAGSKECRKGAPC